VLADSDIPSSKQWFLYILRCSDGSLYTGITTDVDRRVREHRSGSKKAARYTRRFDSVDLVYHISLGDRQTAAKTEYRIKRLSRHDKEVLVERSPAQEELAAFLGLPVIGEGTFPAGEVTW